MQLCFYDNLLKTSNVLSDVIYKEHFDKVENYLHRLEDMNQVANEYSRLVQGYNMRISGFEGDNKVSMGLSGIGLVQRTGDTIFMSFGNDFSYSSYFTGDKSKDNSEYHNELVKRMTLYMEALKETMVNESVYDTFWCSDTSKSLKRKEEGVDTISANNIKLVRDMTRKLEYEIPIVRKHIMDDKYKILMDWATVDTTNQSAKKNSGSPYIDTLVNRANDRKCCRKICFFENCDSKNFYPTLLLLHTLIVLVLAFVTQLIISDKSVTEPL